MTSRSDAIRAGLARAAELGRKPGRPVGSVRVPDTVVKAAIRHSTKAGAKAAGLSVTQFIARRRKLEGVASDE